VFGSDGKVMGRAGNLMLCGWVNPPKSRGLLELTVLCSSSS